MNELLVERLKALVIQECNVKNLTPAEIPDTEPIVGGQGALKLDSLDAVEIAAALERKFDLKLDNVGATRVIFTNFNVMSDYVREKAAPDRVAQFLS